MKNVMKNFLVRATSGFVYVAIIVAMCLFGGSYGFPALCCLFAIPAAYELQRIMSERPFDGTSGYDVIAATALTALPALTAFTDSIATTLAFAIFLLVARLVIEIYAHRRAPQQKLATSMLTYCYVAIPLAITSQLYIMHGAWLVLTMFMMIWLNDTGAYLVGSAFGRHKLFPRLSPKKSWEGFIGGLIFSAAVAFLVPQLFPSVDITLPTWQICIIGIIVSVAATWGDLVESMLKRAAGLKDSGSIMPGHGGILDRIDSLLLVAPTIMILILLIA